MSQMQAIKEYIETCPLLENEKINVDYLKDDVYSYSIDRTPTQPTINKFVGGGSKKQITFDFSVTLPLSSEAFENLINSQFGEDFVKWIETQNKKHILPNIEGAFKIECTSPNYMLQKTETTAIYIIQMNLVYYDLISENISF